MKQGSAVKMGDALVYAPNESTYLSGGGKKAVVRGNRTVIPDGKAKGVKMVVALVDGEEKVLSYKDLWADWDRYNARHQEARRASRDALATTQGLLDRLVAHGVIDAQPTDEESGGEGRGGVHYWLGPVKYRRWPDGRPGGVEIKLDPVAAARLLALLPNPPEEG